MEDKVEVQEVGAARAVALSAAASVMVALGHDLSQVLCWFRGFLWKDGIYVVRFWINGRPSKEYRIDVYLDRYPEVISNGTRWDPHYALGYDGNREEMPRFVFDYAGKAVATVNYADLKPAFADVEEGVA